MRRAVTLALLCAGAVCGAPELTIQRMALHQFEDGPVLDSSYELLPGEAAYFSCRLDGYTVDESDQNHRKVKLAWRMEVRDPAGVLIEEPAQGRIDAELFAEDTNWLPKFLHTFMLPPFAPGGRYEISVRVHDEVADRDVSGEMTFRVKGPIPAPKPPGSEKTLTFSGLMFVANEHDTTPLAQRIYKPGSQVWVRLTVSGYRFEANNRFLIEFGLAVEGPDGKQLFSQPDAGGVSNESFYPQSYAPGMLTVTLGDDVAPGTYTLIVTVRDQVGEQTVEIREPFRVE